MCYPDHGPIADQNPEANITRLVYYISVIGENTLLRIIALVSI